MNNRNNILYLKLLWLQGKITFYHYGLSLFPTFLLSAKSIFLNYLIKPILTQNWYSIYIYNKHCISLIQWKFQNHWSNIDEIIKKIINVLYLFPPLYCRHIQVETTTGFFQSWITHIRVTLDLSCDIKITLESNAILKLLWTLVRHQKSLWTLVKH